MSEASVIREILALPEEVESLGLQIRSRSLPHFTSHLLAGIIGLKNLVLGRNTANSRAHLEVVLEAVAQQLDKFRY